MELNENLNSNSIGQFEIYTKFKYYCTLREWIEGIIPRGNSLPSIYCSNLRK